MAETARGVLERSLMVGGFISHGNPARGLLDRLRMAESATASLRYGPLFKLNDTSVDYVYETPTDLPVRDPWGTPQLYGKALDVLTTQAILSLRAIAWSQGRAPTLWIATPETLRIYDCFARPARDDREETALLASFEVGGGGLDGLVPRFARPVFDSGDFWRGDDGARVAKGTRVDQAMLDDLRATEARLAAGGVPRVAAQSLLGRVLFVASLQDRGLLGPAFFSDRYGQTRFQDLLVDRTMAYAFFTWVRDRFNGDLFPILAEEDAVGESHLRAVGAFLDGALMHPDPTQPLQLRLWPYRFDAIPVELIGSMYEQFVHARDPKGATAASVHYTRPAAAEALLGLALHGLPHTARVLDPGCGSGIFLVEAFRRLAWRAARELHRPLLRAELDAMLREQIFGMDLDRTAVRITAFNLYLALLELAPASALEDALPFPTLLAPEGDPHAPANLYVQDFCNTVHPFNTYPPFSPPGFDLQVGNPPWTALKPETAPRDPDDPEQGKRWALAYAKYHHIPQFNMDQAFLHRARAFARPGGRIAFLVAARLFNQEPGKARESRFLDEFLASSTLETVVNLSDLVRDKVLFGGASPPLLPASAVLFRPEPPLPDHRLQYIAPRWYPGVLRARELLIDAVDVQVLDQEWVRANPALWKIALRGTPRDAALFDRLASLPTLAEILERAGVRPRLDRAYGVTIGKGVGKDASALQGFPYLTSKYRKSPSGARYAIDVANLPPFQEPLIAGKSTARALPLPTLVLFRTLLGCRGRVALVEGEIPGGGVVVDTMHYGVSLARAPGFLPARLNGVLNAALTFYAIFMSSPAVGSDRRIITPSDWLGVRLPASILDRASIGGWAALEEHERTLRSLWRAGRGDSPEGYATQMALDEATLGVYGLSAQERLVVRDSLRFSADSFLHRREEGDRHEATLPPTREELVAYATRVCAQLDPLLGSLGLELRATIYDLPVAGGLAVCRFFQTVRGPGERIRLEAAKDVERALATASVSLRARVADGITVRRTLHVYEGEAFWILKAAHKRLWSESAGLRDADLVLEAHLHREGMPELMGAGR